MLDAGVLPNVGPILRRGLDPGDLTKKYCSDQHANQENSRSNIGARARETRRADTPSCFEERLLDGYYTILVTIALNERLPDSNCIVAVLANMNPGPAGHITEFIVNRLPAPNVKP